MNDDEKRLMIERVRTRGNVFRLIDLHDQLRLGIRVERKATREIEKVS